MHLVWPGRCLLRSALFLAVLGVCRGLKFHVPIRYTECIDDFVSHEQFEAAGETGGQLVGRLLLTSEPHVWPDVTVQVFDPHGMIIWSKDKAGPEVEIAAPAVEPGNYQLCVSNVRRSRAEVFVDVVYLTLAHLQGQPVLLPKGREESRNKEAAHPSQLEEARHSIAAISEMLEVLAGEQKYMQKRLERHLKTTESTNKRTWHYTLLEAIALIGLAVVQIYTIKSYFSKTSQHRAAV